MNTTKTAAEVFSAITEAAKSHKPDVRRFATMKPGEFVRQGDIYAIRVGDGDAWAESIIDNDLRSAVLAARAGASRIPNDGQLALGTTQGSRHCLDGNVRCIRWFESNDPRVGPSVLSPSERVRIPHPEHGHLDLPPGEYQITYQRDYTRERAEEIRRVAD